MMKEQDVVVGMGELLWDLLPEGKKVGGAPANFAYHVSQFGLPSCVVSAVGEDLLGAEMQAHLTQKGVTQLVTTLPYPTGTVQVTLDAVGVPQYDIREQVAWDYLPYTPELEALARRTRAVCFGSLAQRGEPSRRTITRFLEAMPKEEGRLMVFDVNLRQSFYTQEVLQHSLEQCNILKINDEELVVLAQMLSLGGESPEAQCQDLLRRYQLQMLILTCGVEGSYLFTPEGISFQPTPQVRVADTVGAGDSFTATFIASILKGQSVSDAHARAVAVSAYVCTQKGAMPLLPPSLLL